MAHRLQLVSVYEYRLPRCAIFFQTKCFSEATFLTQTKEIHYLHKHLLIRASALIVVHSKIILFHLQNYNQRMYKSILLILLVIAVSSAPDWTKVNDLFIEAINDRVFPGGSVTVANQTHIIYRKNFGYLTYSNQIHDVEVTNQTKYDIASVTKILGTTLGVMELVTSSSIKLTDLVSKYYPNYDTNKKTNTTIANLLLHNAGLPFDYPGKMPASLSQIMDYIIFAKPISPVGTQFHYSNLGFLLLSQIVANVSRKSFDKYFEQNKIFAGLKNTNFNPPQSEWYKIAPTEYDQEVRKRIVRGQAHQRVTYSIGGVAGHSGLFSDADDLIRYMRILLNNGKIPNEPTRILPEAVVTQFTTRVEGLPYANSYGYGFSTGCPGTKMKLCFGHDGSTGIMTWVNREKKIAFVVMNNRGHPDVKNGKIDAFKPKIADAIMEALGY